MTRHLIALISVSILGSGCGFFAASEPSHPAQASIERPKSARKSKAVATASSTDADATDSKRRVGDFFVHRFSGSFRNAPLTLTEEVIAIEEGLLVIDYTLEERGKSTRLRIRLDPKRGSIERVSRLGDDGEIEAAIADYEALLEKTAFAADDNDGLIDSERQTCLVGPDELDCEMKNYRVTVGGKQAVLSVTESEAAPGRDLGGQIVTEDGKVIYRAELIEMRQGEPSSSVASK
jgi:hypothetical protein